MLIESPFYTPHQVVFAKENHQMLNLLYTNVSYVISDKAKPNTQLLAPDVIVTETFRYGIQSLVVSLIFSSVTGVQEVFSIRHKEG